MAQRSVTKAICLSDPEVNRLLGDPGCELTEVKLLHFEKANVDEIIRRDLVILSFHITRPTHAQNPRLKNFLRLLR